MARYWGTEPCTSTDLIVRYLMDNYADAQGQPMPFSAAADIVFLEQEQIRRGIEVFRSNVEYLGDEALKNSGAKGWTFIEGSDDEYDGPLEGL